MKIEERNEKLVNIKKEINHRLTNLDFYKKKELVLWLTKNENYQRLKETDNQLSAMEFWKNVWLQEIQNPEAFEFQGDAFGGVESLEVMEAKYLALQFAIIRMESNVPHEYCVESLLQLEEYKCSAYAMFCGIEREGNKSEQLVLQIADILLERNMLVKGIGLLRIGVSKYPNNTNLILMLANAWLTVGQWENAHRCLSAINKPTQEVQELKSELEKIIKNETI